MAAKLIVFDESKCIRCHSCEVACQLENDAPPGLRLRWVRSWQKGELPHSKERLISRACFHCEDPACVSACPAGALVKRDDGVVEHLLKRCIGCKYCIKACPYQVPKFDSTRGIMRKCSYCTQRIDRGKEPACVAKCPTGALTYYPNGNAPEGLQAYGRPNLLHMVYTLHDKPHDYELPDPVPGDVVRKGQVWKWLAGIVPGGLVLGWLWRMANVEEETDD